jgi:predicted porin
LPDLQLAMQVVWHDAGQTDEAGLRIDYGLASYNLLSTESSLLAIRAGRVVTPLGFYNETRDVASTRPSILLPQSIYFDRNRNLALSADGGYVYGEHRTDFGDFSFNFGLIIPRTEDPDFMNTLLGNDSGTVKGDTSWVTRVGYESPGGRVRFAVTYADFLSDFRSSERPMNEGSFHFTPLILSAQYNAERWTLTAEYALRRYRLDYSNIPSDVGVTGQSYYIQGTYRFTDKLEGLARYDELVWDLNDQYGYRHPSRLGPHFSRYARDWTFGLRYEILPSLLMSAEYHHINGTGWISRLENTQNETQRWDMYAFMLSYNF